MDGEHLKFKEPDQAFLDKVRRYLKKINSALQDEDFLDLRASRYRYAQPICEPCYLDRFLPVACWGVVNHAEALAHLAGVLVPLGTSYFGHKLLTFR